VNVPSLQDDIALALKAMSIRLIVPIPGKSAIGIEVPNSISSVVSLRELIDSPLFKSKKSELPLILGKDTSGKTLIADLAGMPHIIIAGTTGSGKTVCVNSNIISLLYHATPDQLKLVMIDPKMVEIFVYNACTCHGCLGT
jgi:S-DNA-T family DNA segregation ATPase FtsK/SpoIIIE